MAVKKMGFEGVMYGGTQGSTAATQVGNVRDVTITNTTTRGKTTVRGTSGVPISTERVTENVWSCSFQMLNKSDDTLLEAFKVAAAAGTPVALRMIDYAAGKGYDGDVVLEITTGQPLAGEQTVDITAVPNDDNRAPQLYV